MARRLDGRRCAATPAYPECLAELDADALSALGEEYLERTQVQRTDRPFFIDKMPNNWAHVGLIRLILPNAKIIDARRIRSPAAFPTSSSISPAARASPTTSATSAYYRDYVTLMRHFDPVQPGYVHRVIHERLVDDPEAEVRRLLDYCGLPFDPPACASTRTRAVRTASSEQVRRPISREGLDQWQAFEPWLDPLKEALGPVLPRIGTVSGESTLVAPAT